MLIFYAEQSVIVLYIFRSSLLAKMSLEWMKEHTVQIGVGLVVVAMLMMLAFPCVCDCMAQMTKSPTCVGATCPRKVGGAIGMNSG